MRNLHAPRIAPHYLCKQKCLLAPLALSKIPPAPLTQRPHREKERASASPSECSECSEISDCSPALLPHPRRRSKAPATPLRHRSTRTLNPLADAPPHHASPIFISHPTRAIGSEPPRWYPSKKAAPQMAQPDSPSVAVLFHYYLAGGAIGSAHDIDSLAVGGSHTHTIDGVVVDNRRFSGFILNAFHTA